MYVTPRKTQLIPSLPESLPLIQISSVCSCLCRSAGVDNTRRHRRTRATRLLFILLHPLIITQSLQSLIFASCSVHTHGAAAWGIIFQLSVISPRLLLSRAHFCRNWKHSSARLTHPHRYKPAAPRPPSAFCFFSTISLKNRCHYFELLKLLLYF